MLGDAVEGVHNLKISDVGIDDNGIYECQVGPGVKRFSTPIKASSRVSVLCKSSSLFFLLNPMIIKASTSSLVIRSFQRYLLKRWKERKRYLLWYLFSSSHEKAHPVDDEALLLLEHRRRLISISSSLRVSLSLSYVYQTSFFCSHIPSSLKRLKSFLPRNLLMNPRFVSFSLDSFSVLTLKTYSRLTGNDVSFLHEDQGIDEKVTNFIFACRCYSASSVHQYCWSFQWKHLWNQTRAGRKSWMRCFRRKTCSSHKMVPSRTSSQFWWEKSWWSVWWRLHVRNHRTWKLPLLPHLTSRISFLSVFVCRCSFFHGIAVPQSLTSCISLTYAVWAKN